MVSVGESAFGEVGDAAAAAGDLGACADDAGSDMAGNGEACDGAPQWKQVEAREAELKSKLAKSNECGGAMALHVGGRSGAATKSGSVPCAF